MIKNDEIVPYLLALNEWQNWLIRAAISFVIMMTLAFAVKHTLITPHSVSVIEFEIQMEKIFNKGMRV